MLQLDVIVKTTCEVWLYISWRHCNFCRTRFGQKNITGNPNSCILCVSMCFKSNIGLKSQTNYNSHVIFLQECTDAYKIIIKGVHIWTTILCNYSMFHCCTPSAFLFWCLGTDHTFKRHIITSHLHMQLHVVGYYTEVYTVYIVWLAGLVTDIVANSNSYGVNIICDVMNVIRFNAS